MIRDADSPARAPQVLVDDAQDAAESAAKAQQALIDAAREAVESAADDIVETTVGTDIDALAAALDEAIEREKDSGAALDDLDDVDRLQVVLATTAVNQARAVLDSALEDLA